MDINMDTCECGNEKLQCEQACDRCLYLDGHGEGEARMINALRAYGVSNIYELASYAGCTTRTVQRTLRELHRHGRVERIGYIADGGHGDARLVWWQLVERKSAACCLVD